MDSNGWQKYSPMGKWSFQTVIIPDRDVQGSFQAGLIVFITRSSGQVILAVLNMSNLEPTSVIGPILTLLELA